MEITSDIVTAFRAFFKDFADLDKWPDDIVITALYEADTEIGGTGWVFYEDIPQNFNLAEVVWMWCWVPPRVLWR